MVALTNTIKTSTGLFALLTIYIYLATQCLVGRYFDRNLIDVLKNETKLTSSVPYDKPFQCFSL